jgi:hemerythrin-like domain-containing protein
VLPDEASTPGEEHAHDGTLARWPSLIAAAGATIGAMPMPIDSLLFVHQAIATEAASIERAVADASGPEDIGALADGITYFCTLVDLHTRGEEIGLFPVLAEKAPQIDVTYVFDHAEERELFSAIADSLKACGEGDADALTKLRRQTVVLHEHAAAHIRKENTLLIPWVRENIAPPDQGAMVQKILSTISPEQTAVAIPWIVNRIPLEMAKAYIGVLGHAMPPPVFAAAKGWIAEGCLPERTAELADVLA